MSTQQLPAWVPLSNVGTADTELWVPVAEVDGESWHGKCGCWVVGECRSRLAGGKEVFVNIRSKCHSWSGALLRILREEGGEVGPLPLNPRLPSPFNRQAS